MKGFKALSCCVFSIAFILFAFHAEVMGQEEIKADSIGPEVTMITLYDNYKHNPDLKTGWGFSCLIKAADKNILFDTGADSPTLLGNMKKLEIEPKDIDVVVLSHIHGDHIGGLSGILEANSDLTVYVPESFPQDFKKGVKSFEAKVVEVDDPVDICENVSTTGELGASIKEQSLLIKTSKGLVVLTGCAHPGIVKIVKEAKKITGEDIYLVLGGFHLLNESESGLEEIINEFRELKVKKAAPCHCSGDKTREIFQKEYKENFISNGVGKIIELQPDSGIH
jgi:7,8-dihydropterin-6-yl-methyl-4-(beta-D-ribofuranosyl)aminobenzene 5'-phosphate synthase